MSNALSAGMSHLFEPGSGVSRLVSSWDARPIEKYPGVPPSPYVEEFKRKCVGIAPGESFTVADLEGPGVINRFYFHYNVRWPRSMSRGLELRFYWDGEEEPSVCAPLGDFFGSPFCKYVEYDAFAQSMLNGGYVSRFPMPFRKRARLVIRNASPYQAERELYGVTYLRDVELPDDLLHFHARWNRANPTEEGVPYEVLDAAGRGQYVGCHLFQQNRDAWIGRGPGKWIFPAGSGMGNMEGWDEVYVDGEAEPSQHDTGTEEYFNTGPYFTHGRSTGIFDGCTVRSYLTGRMAAYRFHVYDPIPFNSRFRMIWRHGLLDSIRADFASTAFWYQAEPHVPFDLPPFEDRLPSSWLTHGLRSVALFPMVLGTKLLCRTIAA